MLREEVLYGIRKHFDCSSEVPFEECTFCIEGSSLWRKVVFVVIRTFCKSSSTTVEGSDMYDEKGMVNVGVV